MPVETMMRYPDFFIVGAAKSGTTSLWKYLGCHEKIFMTKEIEGKELGFFCDDYGVKDKEYYLSFFSKATKEQLVGESCHAYLTSPESADLIKNHNENSKIIVVLRNPIERAYSLYNWMVQNGYEYRSFKKSLRREKYVIENKEIVAKPYYHSYWRNYLYIHSGLYYQQLKRYYEKFPAENILVILSDDLKSNPLEATNKVLKFLGLREFHLNEVTFKQENESLKIYSPWLNFVCFNLIRRYRKVKTARAKFIRGICEQLLKINQINKKPRRLDPRLRKVLHNAYVEDIQKLGKLLKLDLSRWLDG